MFGKGKTIENAHIVPDSDIELLPLPRPCMARGVKAFFHRWSDKQEIVIQDRSIFMHETLTKCEIDNILNRVRKGYVSPEYDVYTRRETVAVVEFEDGTVDEVAPRDIKFTEPCYYGNLIINSNKLER